MEPFKSSLTIPCSTSARQLISSTEFLPTLKAIFAIYLIASTSFRLAFLPEFKLSIGEYPGFIVLDLLATLLFSCETIRLARLTISVISPRSILPEFERPLEESAGHSQRSYDDSVDLQPERTLVAYWRVTFLFVSTFPFEYVSWLLWGDGVSANYFLLNRLLMLFHLPKYVRNLAIAMVRNGYLRNIGVRRTAMLFFTMALAGHLCGCGFFLVARLQAMDEVALTWPEVYGLYNLDSSVSSGIAMKSTSSEAYITSLYWAYITMITTGFGDIVPLHVAETIWAIFSMFVGFIITALTIANLQKTIGDFDAARLDFQRKMELIKKFLHYRGLPKVTQEKVIKFYDYQWRTLKGADEEQFLIELPRSLQQQVTNYMCRDIIASLPILRRANKALLNALVECAEMNIYSPDDDVTKYGEKIRGAILVSNGEIEVLKGGITERKMKRRDRFGQDCLFVDKVSEYNLRSKGYSEVILIPRIRFQQIIHHQCDKEYIAQLEETASTISKSRSKANKMFGSGEDITPVDGFKKHCHPNSFFRKCWDCLILLGLIFYTFSIPLSFMHLVENTPFSDTPALLCLGYAIDVFFWIDVILEHDYFFYFESGLVVFDRDHIRQRFYQEHHLVREIMGLVPFDVASCFLGGRFCHHFRLAKLVRIPNIAMYMESVDVMLAELKVDVDLSIYRLVKLNILMLVVCHWCGCLWYMIASLSIVLGHSHNWRQADESNDSLSISHSDLGGFAGYLRSTYWAIVGMSTVGYGDIIPTNITETAFATVVILFGGLVLPAVVGGLATYITNFRMTAKLFQKQITKVRRYLLRIKVGDDILLRVKYYYDYHWSCQGGVAEQEVLNELPITLRDAVSSNELTELGTLPFLHHCDEATAQLIASVLQPQVFMPQDSILKEGERCFDMYFLKRGQAVETYSLQGPHRILSENDFFGENFLVRSSLSEVTTTAISYCECFSLNRNDFKDAIACSPFAQQVRIDLANFVVQAKKIQQRAMTNFVEYKKCARFMVEHTNAATKRDVPLAPILPGSPFLLTWNTLMTCVCVYNTAMVPFCLAFNMASNEILVIDWATDLLLVVDMLLNYRYIACIQDGKLEEEQESIKRNYMASRFRVDLISTLPLDIIAHFLLPETPIVGELLRFLKVIRLGRHFGSLGEVFHVLEDHHISSTVPRFIEFIAVLVLIAHWVACGFYSLARWQSDRADCSHLVAAQSSEWALCQWEGTWIQRQIHDGKLPSDGGNNLDHWVRSIYWALPTLIAVVIGDVIPTTSMETLYAFLVMAFGVTVNAAIVGIVAINILSNLESDRAIFAGRVDVIRDYIHKHHLGNDLLTRVNDFARYLRRAHRGNVREDEFVYHLPHMLQTDVITQTRTKLLLRCPFFDFCTHDIVNALALCLMPKTFCMGDLIVSAGDFGQSMFFLQKGTVQVVLQRSTTLITLHEGSFFGETSLFLKQPRSSSVCATTFCDVFELRRIDLYSELQRRDTDISYIQDIFSRVHKENERRNKAVQIALSASRKPGTKLSKLITHQVPKARNQKVLMIFMPGSSFTFFFDAMCMILMLYFLVAVPYRKAFSREGEEGRIYMLDILADLFFIADLYLRSTCFTFMHNGSICANRKAIFQRYMKTGMVTDAISCVSVLEIFAPRLQFRLLSLLRGLRIPFFHRAIRVQLSQRGVRLSLATNLLARITLLYMLANHGIACFWFILHRYVERNMKYTWATSDCPWGSEAGSNGCLAKWDDTLGEHNICNVEASACYLRSLHFSLVTLSTVGYGDISPTNGLETLFEICCTVTGACFMACFIGAFGVYLSECDTIGSNAFKAKVQKLTEYLRYRDIPEEIQASILFFHHCRWKNSQTLDEHETLSILPESLQLDISFALKQKVIRLVPILDSLSEIFQKRVAAALELQVYSVRDYPIIYSQGDIGWEIYFISSGMVTVSLPIDLVELDTTARANSVANKEKFASIGLILGAGNHFGESCLCSESGVRQETMVAGSIKAELYMLSKEKLTDVCRLMGPEKGRQLLQSMLMKNNRNWHTFDDPILLGVDDIWEECTHRQRQNSMERNHSFFPWSKATTSHNMGEMTRAEPHHGRMSQIRRGRRQSQGGRASAFFNQDNIMEDTVRAANNKGRSLRSL